MQIQPFACIVAGLLLLSCTLQTSVAEADHGKMKSMAEVLQILQNLDKYYTQAARPRYSSPANTNSRYPVGINRYSLEIIKTSKQSEVSVPAKCLLIRDNDNSFMVPGKVLTQTVACSPFADISKIQEAVHKIRLRELDRNYLQRTRPRFGKRNYPGLEEGLMNREDVPIGDRQLWERFVR